MGLRSPLTAEEIVAIARDGIKRIDTDVPLYVCPMLFGGSGFIYPDPDDTRFVMCIYENPLPENPSFTAMRSSFRRPSPETAPTQAKASSLYPNVGRAVLEAKKNGFDTGVMLDPLGHVAEFSYANLFMVKDGIVSTPAINGTFLNGITRQRVIKLLRSAGLEVQERTIRFEELLDADELFGTGNYYKVAPCVKLDGVNKPAGPITAQAAELYWAFAESGD
jgi:branched-chain amino acid aminotransferase